MSHRILRMKYEKLSCCQKVWNQIFNDSPNSSPFVSFEWFDCLSRFLVHTDPDVMLFYDQKICVGIIPVQIKDSTVRFITDERVTDLTGFVCVRGYEDDIIRELVSFIRRERLHADLSPLDHANPLVQRSADFLHNVTLEKADVNPLLELPASWDDYLAILTAKLRHELRRKLRKGHAIRLETCKPEAINVLFELMAHDAQKRQFLMPDMQAFFTAIATCFFERGWLRLRIAHIDGKPIATLLAFSFHKRIYLYNMGVESSYMYLSPGIVAIGLDIKDAITEGNKYYDFLRGDEEYKFRFGARRQHTMRLRA